MTYKYSNIISPPYIKLLLLSTILSLSFFSCVKPDENDIPSYLKIDSSAVKTSATQGTASHKITDIWVYHNNNLLGVYELPAKFPILLNGNLPLDFYPGIKLNGVSTLRIKYPFYEKVTKTVQLSKDSVNTLPLIQYRYKENTIFEWQENFETTNFSLEKASGSHINLTRIHEASMDAAFPNEFNEFAGKILIPNDTLIFEYKTHQFYPLPTTGGSVFLEINYKSNNPFSMGIISEGNEENPYSIIQINPSKNWNKIYVSLTDAILANNPASKFKVFFRAKKTTSEAQAEIYIDNIKLLHF